MTPKQFVDMVARMELKSSADVDVDDCFETLSHLIEHAKHIDAERCVDNMTLMPAAIQNAIESARARYAADSDDDIEVDDFPAISIGDGGMWVAMWGWVPNEDDDEDEPLTVLPIAACPHEGCCLPAGHEEPHDDIPF